MDYKEIKDFLKSGYNVKSVAKGVVYWKKYLLSKTINTLFTYRPDEKIKKMLSDNFFLDMEKSLILKGNSVAVVRGGKVYAPFGGAPYGITVDDIPNLYTFSNTVIKGGSGLKDGEQCVIMWNSDMDKILRGTQSMTFETINRYAALLAHCESTFVNALIQTRAGLAGEASNGTAAQGIDMVMKKLEAGEPSYISNVLSQYMDTIKPLQIPAITSYTQFTETRDYLLNCFFNEISFQTMEEKKERMTTAEATGANSDGDILENNANILYRARCENMDKLGDFLGGKIIVKKKKIMEVGRYDT